MSVRGRRREPSGFLDSAYMLVSSSARTAVALTLDGPAIVRGLAGLVTQAAQVTGELRPVLGDALRAVPRVVDLIEQLVGVAVELQRTLDRVAPHLHRLGDAAPSLETIAEAVPIVERIADAAPTLRALAAAVDDLHTLAGAAPALTDLAGAVAALEKLTDAIGAVETLAEHADTTLPELPPRLRSLDDALATAAGELQKVTPDVRTVAGRIDALDEQIKVLADALAPLQGTTERLGRLVDRLPRRSGRGEAKSVEG